MLAPGEVSEPGVNELLISLACEAGDRISRTYEHDEPSALSPAKQALILDEHGTPGSEASPGANTLPPALQAGYNSNNGD